MSPERKRKRRSGVVSQAGGSTAQVYSVQSTEKNKINSPKKILKVIFFCEQDSISKLLDITKYPYIR